MTLQEQVCTLQQAQRLKGLGCEQGCQHFWVQIEQEWFVLPRLLWENKFDKTEYYRAYTVAELGKMLVKRGINVMFRVAGGLWWHQTKYYGTEAQARAALLIHMLEKEKEHGN